ncbi:MAG TPA: M48 family metalloprotease [Acidobacteriota bacterium]|nr:M48 family metalloprotease [Acidobacteriota bacterium]HNB70931.1 M48 family metalloprotease [Acidobacteriota bacterium]HNC45440.1 M48 family metalloprotease [Acidobacteriota bacterium]HNG93744.1 M48 family metalloprotease [Acidobacteriota bacterium]HNJ41051.1 M48 family metalloprotease [Acidobacteriota bacterium]
MKLFTTFLAISLIISTLSPGQPSVLAHSNSPHRQKGGSIEDAIIDAVGVAVPLGKEAVRSLVKPILDTVTITPQQEMQIGNQFFQNIKKKLGSKLDRDQREVAYVTSIGNVLATNVKRKGIKYKFHVVEDRLPNAFAIAGGHVFIYRGLLETVIENEAQLAAVIGHEISHVDAEHTVDFYKPVVAASQLPFADVSVLIAALGSKLLTFSYSEVQESEADNLGTVLAFKAGYEPAEGKNMQQRLGSLKSTGATDPLTGLADTVFRTHPPSQKRAAAIDALSKKLHTQKPNQKTYVGEANYRQRIPMTQKILE